MDSSCDRFEDKYRNVPVQQVGNANNEPIVITEVTTTRTITISDDADLKSDPNIASLIAQFSDTELHSSDPNPTMGVRNAHYIPPVNDYCGGEDDTSVYYISEDEEANQKAIRSRSHIKSHKGKSSVQPRNGAYSSIRSSPPPSHSKFFLSSEDILSPLGSFSELEATSDVAKMIKAYTINSIYIQRGSSMKVKVCRILKKKGLLPNFLSGNGDVTKSEHRKRKTNAQNNVLAMLLWFKTTPDSVRRLAAGEDSCTAFYDRASRALPSAADKMHDNWRQTVLLCKVTLGNMLKSEHGYSHWRKCHRPPKGCDSVKGVGKYTPNWKKNLSHKSTIVPVGETEKSTRFPSFEIDYNEYMVFQSHQIKVKYAVDIKFVSRKSHHPSYGYS
ncbi:uncharacterized protein LOC110851932 isoform X3 [Folsomia candida]|uniref:uncharacterized protein LOC110851932 isoform X3 n=1 Tax=Folsomia candida TaxID=158441 RepID=UPI001604F38B|nr:uncharacterized protein LOC110851932 isoform X3 [Folsomia candida]